MDSYLQLICKTVVQLIAVLTDHVTQDHNH